jgi:hypothetical protein
MVGARKCSSCPAGTDPETVLLEAPIVNDAPDANGRMTAWVIMQGYASLEALHGARHTFDLDSAG